MGDFNAKIGNTKEDHHLRTVVGKYGLGQRNERGERLLQFCIDNSFTIANTVFQQHARRLFTWRSPDGQHKKKIDFILIRLRWRSSIANSDVGSDHQLLMAVFKIKLKVCFKNKTPRMTLPNDIDKFNSTVSQESAEMKTNSDKYTTNQIWENLKKAVTKATMNSENRSSGPVGRQPWIRDNTLDLCEIRRKVKEKGLDDTNRSEQYRTLSREIQRLCREDKNVYYQDICKDIEEHYNTNQTKDLFKKIKILTRSFKPRSWSIKDDNGNIITNINEALDVWKDYCTTLYDDDEYEPSELLSSETEPNILMSEVTAAIKALKKGKAIGIDSIPAEIWSALDEENVSILHQLCQQIWITGEWPEEWSVSSIIPLHKKGSTLDCSNYRLISLISHASKVMLYVLRSRLTYFLSHQIAPEQAGFVKGRGTREQILNVRILIEKAREYHAPMYLCFVDYEKAFDNVRWLKLWEVLLDMGVPKHLINLIKHLYGTSRAVVRIDNKLSGTASIKKGVRQGCVLSPLLFNIYTESLMREVLDGWEGGFAINGKKISNLRYADDTLLIANSAEELSELLQRLEEISRQYNLKINYVKSKIMIVDRDNGTVNRPHHIANCEVVEQFIYLGALIHSSGSCELEIRRRIQLGRTAMSQLQKIWKDRHITIKTKKSLVHALVFSIFWYASETWVIRANDRKRIDAFEMWVWRRMLRIPWTAHRTNVSVLDEIKPDNRLSSLTSARILNFFGHISRHDNIERLIVQGKPLGKRKRGRSPSRWTDIISKVTDRPLIEAIRTTTDRGRWRETVRRILENNI